MITKSDSVKLKIISLIFFIVSLASAQNYEKDWSLINKKLEKGDSVPVQTLLKFAEKHAVRLNQYPDNSTQLYSLLGNNYSQLNNYVKAEENYQISYRYAQTAQDTSLKHVAALSLAILNQNYHHYMEAEKYYLKCMAGMAAIYGQSSREYTELFYYYTGLLIGLGKYTDANPYVDALLYYYKTLDGENNLRYITLQYYKAIVYQNLGDYPAAIKIFDEEVREKRSLKLGDTATYVTGISNLGDVYREAGDYNKAVFSLEMAERLFTEYQLKDESLLSTIENNLGLCYKGLSNPRKAEMAYNHAIRIHQSRGETTTEAYCTVLSNKANLYTELGRFGEASELLWTAIEIRKAYYGETSENYANALANLAIVFFNSELYQKSLEKNLEAYEIYKVTVGKNHQSYANILNSLALCYEELKNYKKAEEYKLKALDITERTVGKDHYRYSSFLISSASIYKHMNQLPKAEKNLKEALILIDRNFGKKHDLYANAQWVLAEIYWLQQNFEAAAPLYIECTDHYSKQMDDYFDAMSEVNQMSFTSQIFPVFESYKGFVMNYRIKHPEKNISEHLKLVFKYQLQLKSLLANRSALVQRELNASNDEGLKTSYAEWISLKNQLINRFKATETSDDNNELFGKISVAESNLKAKLKNFSSKKELTYETIRQNLSDQEAAIEIFKVYEQVNDSVTAIRYGALVAGKKTETPRFVIFKNGNAMDSANFDHYSACIDNQKKDSQSFKNYFNPLLSSLTGIKRVYISSDGVFHKLSFLSLYNPVSKKYLVEDYEIFQTSNLGLIVNSQKQDRTANTSAALFGYPDYEYDFKKNKTPVKEPELNQLVATRFGLTALSQLPGTKVEVEEISKTLKTNGWKAEVFMEKMASEENVRKINAPGVLHIATHGFYLKDIESEDKLFLGFDKITFKQNAMLRSGLILAGAGPSTMDSTNVDSENDGILTAGEASLLNLNGTDLVVLSACQTGLGDEVGTEGVAGLQRSFAVAGAKNILMSLWPVDDFATQYLMTEFYKNYSVSKDVESSFKKAQAQVKLKYPQPFYWAAFVLLKTFN